MRIAAVAAHSRFPTRGFPMSNKTTAGMSAAIAAAALFLAAPIAQAGNGHAAGTSAMGHCMGANACKGKSDCKTAKNDCSGANACKGQGYLEMTKEECDKIEGATFEPAG
jgi:hypothetical protein